MLLRSFLQFFPECYNRGSHQLIREGRQASFRQIVSATQALLVYRPAR